MPEDPPHPFAFAEKDAFFALPPEEQVPHIWECLQYLEWRRGEGDLPEEEIDRNVRILRHVAQDVAKAVAEKLMAEGAWKNCLDMRWPRFNKGSQDPWYLTGCYPPQGLCVPKDDEAWKSLEDATGQVHFEMTEWLFTPAGLHGFPDKVREQMRQHAKQLAEAVDAERKAFAELTESRARLDEAKKEFEESQKQAGPPPTAWKPYGEG